MVASLGASGLGEHGVNLNVFSLQVQVCLLWSSPPVSSGVSAQ